MKKCGDCKHWNKPASNYEENSIGSCQLFDDWMMKHAKNKSPSVQALNRVMVELGANPYVIDYRHVFMRDTIRKCNRFELS